MFDAVLEATDNFFEFVEAQCKLERPPKYSSVEEYIEAWARDGQAWECCCHDYRLYLATVASIFAI